MCLTFFSMTINENKGFFVCAIGASKLIRIMHFGTLSVSWSLFVAFLNECKFLANNLKQQLNTYIGNYEPNVYPYCIRYTVNHSSSIGCFGDIANGCHRCFTVDFFSVLTSNVAGFD